MILPYINRSIIAFFLYRCMLVKGCAAILFGLMSVTAGAFDLQGKTDWNQRVALGSPESGMIAEVYVKPGARVKKGDKLVDLDLRAVQSVIRKQRAVVKEAKALFVEAQREAGRANELYDRTVLSEHAREVAQLEASSARAQLARAEFNLAKALLAMENSQIVSPFDGVVVTVLARPGETMISNLRSEPLVVVAQDIPMRVSALLPDDKLGKVAEGDKLKVALDGQWYEAHVDSIALEPETLKDISVFYPISAIVELPPRQRAGRPVMLRFED